MSWNRPLVFYLGIVIFCLSIAVTFLLLGFWPILPYAGAELLGLGIAFHLCVRSGEEHELVHDDDTSVTLVEGCKPAEQSWEFNRYWTRVELTPSRAAWYPSRLLLGSHGEAVEVGRFLNEQERRQLSGELRDVINFLEIQG